jgi:SAM-dependent methyltransferase
MAPLDDLDMSYRIACCNRCGFAYADRLPPIGQYDRYYRSLSKYDAAEESAATSPTEEVRCAATVALLRDLFPAQTEIADLGCGSGVLLAALRDAGWHCLAGIDPAPAAALRARARFGIDGVRSGRLEQAPSLLGDLGRFELFCLTGVLEHLPDLRGDMERLVANISAQAQILVEVPALERFASRECEPFGEFSLEHIQYFSASTLTRFFATLGFAPVATQILELPPGSSDSLFGLFSRTRQAGACPEFDGPGVDELRQYVARSEAGLADCLAKITDCKAGSLVLYGAGSHTARLLPRLEEATRRRIVGIVDRNQNLQGKRLGEFIVEAPDALSKRPTATVVVSAYRGRQAIAAMLRATRPNPVLTLY